MDYLALGDSYISGEGVYSYRAGTDNSNNRCHLSDYSYPYLMGSLFKWSSYESVACSGSVIEDIIPLNEQAYNEDERQGKGKFEDIYNQEIYANFLPGYRGQINFVKRNTPDIITISVGGNDIGFDDIVKRCLAPDTCYEFYEDRLELVRQINTKFEELVETYQKIKENTSSGAKIYVIGYPQIAKADGKCGANVHLNSRELEFAEHLINYLNRVIKNAASKTGVFYTDIENSLKPYRLCENDEKLTAVNGLTAGNDAVLPSLGPIGKESYHPNGLGHELIKDHVIRATNRFTDSMPSANLSAAPPAENNLQILNTVKSNRQTYASFYSTDITGDTKERGRLWHVVVKGLKYSLKPLSPVKAVLNSTPVQLGTYITNSSGDLDIQLQTPSNIPPGFHTLHLYGTSIDGSAIDIYRVVYVAASMDDFDGDGLPNSRDKCLAIEPSNTDYDQDGVDDACDSQITDAPISSANASGSGAFPVLATSQLNAAVLFSNPPADEYGQTAHMDSNASLIKAASAKDSVLGTSIRDGRAVESKSSSDSGMGLFQIVVVTGIALLGSFVIYRKQKAKLFS